MFQRICQSAFRFGQVAEAILGMKELIMNILNQSSNRELDVFYMTRSLHINILFHLKRNEISGSRYCRQCSPCLPDFPISRIQLILTVKPLIKSSSKHCQRSVPFPTS